MTSQAHTLSCMPFPNQHADVVCSRAQLNREKGVQRVEDPLAGAGQSPAGVQRQRLWGHSFKMNSTPSVPGPQWQEMTPPARVSMTASK